MQFPEQRQTRMGRQRRKFAFSSKKVARQYTTEKGWMSCHYRLQKSIKQAKKIIYHTWPACRAFYPYNVFSVPLPAFETVTQLTDAKTNSKHKNAWDEDGLWWQKKSFTLGSSEPQTYLPEHPGRKEADGAGFRLGWARNPFPQQILSTTTDETQQAQVWKNSRVPLVLCFCSFFTLCFFVCSVFVFCKV